MRHSWYSWLSFLHSLQLWHVALKRVSGRFGTAVLSYFLFLKTLLFFNLFLFLVTGAFLVLPQAVHPPALPEGRPSFYGLELLTGAVSSQLLQCLSHTEASELRDSLKTVLQVTLRVDVSNFSLSFQGYFSESVMYYGYYCNYTLQQTCRDDVGGPNVSLSNTTRAGCVSKPHSYNMPLAYFFTIGGAFFITCIILVYRYSLKKKGF